MRLPRVTFLVCAAACFSLLGFASAAPAAGPVGLQAAISRAAATANGALAVSRRRGTGLATFVRRADRGDLATALHGRAGADKAEAFLARHGDLFGIGDAATQTVRGSARRDALGWTHVRWRQVHHGLDVVGAELVAHLAPDGRLETVNGATAAIPGPLATVPSVARLDAEQIAAGGTHAATIDARLVVYPRGLVRGTGEEPRLAWAIELASSDGNDAELVMVDALDGRVLERVDRTPDALTRQVSHQDRDDVVWEEGDPDPIPLGWASGSSAAIQGWQDLVDGARESYNFFGSLSLGSHVGFDAADAVMASVFDGGVACPNANWNGLTANFCPGVTSDDVVGHEWGHAYTEYTANFFYAWQSGALDESYADVWGEAIDLMNGRQSDIPGGPRASSGSACGDASYRWLHSENSTAFGGANRDLWQPECKGDPGRVGSDRYWCDEGDGGGVHTNSGVPNHLFALLVDGGTSNGVTVNAIGMVKATNILWRALGTYETPVSDFADHAEALEASCIDLLGAPLGLPVLTPPATWTTAAELIGPADCVALAAAIDAVELRDPPPCPNAPILQPNAPPLCAGLGNVESVATYDFETSLEPWTAGTRAIAYPEFYTAGSWVRSTTPFDRAGATAFIFAGVPDDCSHDRTSGAAFLESPAFTVPTDRRTLQIAFDHWIATDVEGDGGNVKVSVNGGNFNVVPNDHFRFNPYNGTIPPTPYGTDSNPLSGEPGWLGTDGSAIGGSWGQSQIDLEGLAAPGDTIRLRFELGRDRCYGVIGWYVDDVRIYTCSADTVPCPETPQAGCKEAPLGRAKLAVKQSVANFAGNRLQWSWTKGDATSLAEFGDPTATTRYDLCVWDGRAGIPTLVSHLAVPAGSGWKTATKGASYKDKIGVSRVTLRPGVDGMAGVTLQAKKSSLILPTPLNGTTRFAADPTVTVQLVASTGACWTSTFAAGDFTSNTIAKTGASHKGP